MSTPMKPHAQPATKETLSTEAIRWRGMDAWVVRGKTLNVVVTRIGAHLAAIRRTGEELNPLWQPAWATADPATVVPSKQGLYGDGPEAPLLACIVGHNMCIDRFGAAWPGEKKPLHGEAGIVAWKILPPFPDRFEVEAVLPVAKLRVRRRFELAGDTCTLTTSIVNENAEAREVEWAEHPTVGDPFLTGATFTAGVDRVINWPKEPDPGSRFPDLPFEADIPVAIALEMPSPNAAASGDVLTSRVVDGWWMAENKSVRRRLTYRWNAQEFPWLALWTQNRSRNVPPWNGATRARGMEFGTKPFPEGKPPASRATSYLGRPTSLTIAPGRQLTRAFTISWEAW